MVSAAKDVKRDRDALVVANDELRTSREELRLSDEELKERNRQLLDARALAARDGLTGILNRGSFQERVHEEIQRAEESHGTVGLVMVDIDDFKQTNDELGHLEGDRILQEVAAAITTLAPTDTTYRYGGDEFAILVRGVNDDAIAQLAENVRTEVADRLRDRCSATVSVGWTSFPTKASSANELIYGADAAMYEAKGAGKNRVIGSRATARSPENAIITAF
jgi:diguanylate cyclase (GGDEF)-like protein